MIMVRIVMIPMTLITLLIIHMIIMLPSASRQFADSDCFRTG